MANELSLSDTVTWLFATVAIFLLIGFFVIHLFSSTGNRPVVEVGQEDTRAAFPSAENIIAIMNFKTSAPGVNLKSYVKNLQLKNLHISWKENPDDRGSAADQFNVYMGMTFSQAFKNMAYPCKTYYVDVLNNPSGGTGGISFDFTSGFESRDLFRGVSLAFPGLKQLYTLYTGKCSTLNDAGK